MSWLRNSVRLLGGVALAALIVPGCEENKSMLFVRGVIAIDRSDCVAKPDASATLLEEGTLDVSLRANYRAALLVGSQLTQRGSREQLRTETARLTLEGAEVRLEDGHGNLVPGVSPNPYSTAGTGFVDPASGTQPGLGAIFVDIIPGSISNAVAKAMGPRGDGNVLAKVKVFGTTLGGQPVESGEHPFPLRVCSGCLLSYPASSDGRTRPENDYVCATAADDEDVTAGCFFGQDSPVTCSECTPLEVCVSPCRNCFYRGLGLNCVDTTQPACP